MAPSGHRHRLLLYTYMLDRWWQALLGIGIALLVLVAGLGGLPLVLPQMHFLGVEDWKLWTAGGIDGLIILAALLLIAVRKSAYVQPFSDHLRLVTPFLRLNIAYKRIRQSSSTEMQNLFPLHKARGLQQSRLRPLANKTAIVLDLNGYPLPRAALNLFLSPLFFPDKTARLVLLVPDWMAFSTEMESLRGVWRDSLRPPVDVSYPTSSSTPGPKR